MFVVTSVIAVAYEEHTKRNLYDYTISFNYIDIDVVHDDLRNSTCYVYIGIGISCIADSQLSNKEPED